MKRFSALVLICGMLFIPAALAQTYFHPFEDVKGHWAETYIETLYNRGIVTGKSATIFAPNLQVTRAELTKMVLGMMRLGVNSRVRSTPFNDVDEEAWYAPYIALAYEEGFITGYADGSFRPNDMVTRAEALSVVLSAAGLLNDDYEPSYPLPFSDVPRLAWFGDLAFYAHDQGLVDPCGEELFCPHTPINRAETAKLVALSLGLL